MLLEGRNGDWLGKVICDFFVRIGDWRDLLRWSWWWWGNVMLGSGGIGDVDVFLHKSAFFILFTAVDFNQYRILL